MAADAPQRYGWCRHREGVTMRLREVARQKRNARGATATAVLVIGVLMIGTAALAQLAPGGTFTDDDGNPHEPDIEAIAAAGITQGCNPPTNDRYCPNASVTRAEMAAFLLRGTGQQNTLPAFQGYFSDVPNGAWFTGYVERLFELGITTGNANGTYEPNGLVTRAEMAAFVLRAIGEDENLPALQATFSDVAADAWYRPYAERMHQLAITTGCATNPLRYCPNGAVSRAEMASFLTRALGLVPIVPPPPTTTTTLPPSASFGSGTWIVGSEVPAGTYRNSGGSGCYWARLSGFGGTLDEIIANNFDDVINIVTISPTDRGFESSGCGTWRNNFGTRTSSPTAAHGGGHFVIGTEVAAGTWRNSTSTNSCYWERLRGYSGQLADIISNNFSYSIQTVTISSSDVGFYASGSCGTWTYLG